MRGRSLTSPDGARRRRRSARGDGRAGGPAVDAVAEVVDARDRGLEVDRRVGGLLDDGLLLRERPAVAGLAKNQKPEQLVLVYQTTKSLVTQYTKTNISYLIKGQFLDKTKN